MILPAAFLSGDSYVKKQPSYQYEQKLTMGSLMKIGFCSEIMPN